MNAFVGRPTKPESKHRKKIGLTLSPETFVLLPLLAEKLGLDAISHVVDELVKREARRLHLTRKE
jgi:hypothetical protein